jgi:ABC-2 type transport system ATP-binding protein
METVIQVQNLSHSYGEHQALSDLSFRVGQGEVFGLLGPNGAGKTTSVRLLNGMFEANSGSVEVMGFDPGKQGERVRALSGVLTETPALYERLTARQNLRFFGTLDGMSDTEIKERTAQLLHLFDLTDRADDRTGTFSKGMKQRLALARAWMNRPKLLFLDEPTSGLDPEASVQVRELIADVRQKEGTTVLICTHNLDEAQRLCDRLLVMRKGSAVAIGTLEELRKLVSSGLWLQIQFFQPFAESQAVLSGLAGVHRVEVVDDYLSMRVEISSQALIPQVVSALVMKGAQILKLQPQEISLEQVYLKLQNNQKTLPNGGGNYELA